MLPINELNRYYLPKFVFKMSSKSIQKRVIAIRAIAVTNSLTSISELSVSKNISFPRLARGLTVPPPTVSTNAYSQRENVLQPSGKQLVKSCMKLLLRSPCSADS